MYGAGQYAAIAYGNIFGARSQNLSVTENVTSQENTSNFVALISNVTENVTGAENVTNLVHRTLEVIENVVGSETVTKTGTFVISVIENVIATERWFGNWWLNQVKNLASWINQDKNEIETEL